MKPSLKLLTARFVRRLPRQKLRLASIRGLSQRMEDWPLKAAPRIPFTSPNTIRRHLCKQAHTILDVGCGSGQTLKYIVNNGDFATVGVDVFAPFIEAWKSQRSHDDYVLCDARMLPFRRKSFDVVLCLSVIEHLQKDEGERLLKSMEEIARRQVIIVCPVGSAGIGVLADDDVNPTYNVHRSGWLPAELRSLGYKVRGHGIAYVFEWNGYRRLPRLFRLFINPFVLAQPFAYFFARLGDRMVCIKSVAN